MPVDYRSYMKDCKLCPRNCHVNRLGGQRGYCGQTAELRAGRAGLHFWEEPCISGDKGSGTVFFSGCPLRCVYCQNRCLAESRAGKVLSTERLAEVFLELEEKGANNINLVTPTHFVPQIACALELSKTKGLTIPIVYNTGSYEKVETLRLLNGLVDIYLPDLKYVSEDLAKRYSNAPDYFEVASSAIREMFKQVGKSVFETDASGQELMKKGIIVRHLVLPEGEDDSKKVLAYLHETYEDSIYISIMNQYTPMGHFEAYPELNRKISDEVYDRIVDYALDIGIENGFIQEGDTAKESFIPVFDGSGL